MKHLCERGCGQKATYTTWKGNQVCSKVPARCPAVKSKMQATSVERYGVPNASSSKEIKELKKKLALEKYGVDNVSKAMSIKEVITAKAKNRWIEYHKNKKYSIEGLTKKQYIDRCHQYADTMYNRYKEQLDPQGLRGKHWHIDHIYSVADAFLNDVPPNVVSDITNLRLISSSENYSKTRSSHKTLQELYEDFKKSPSHI